jgi:hypothetical protein
MLEDYWGSRRLPMNVTRFVGSATSV